MYYAMRASAPSLHRESTDSLISSRVAKSFVTVYYSDPKLFAERTMEGLQINDKRPAPAPPGTDDGKFSFGEVFDYIQHGRYPEGVSKSDKNTLRRRAKFFRVNDKDLYYSGGGLLS